MPKDTIVVFTARSPERIVLEGGSQSWVLNASRARACTWLLCTQNRHNSEPDFSDATQPHGAGFLVGKIAGLQQSKEEGQGDRWNILIREFAAVDLPNAWKGWRNPVRYMSLEDFGIDPHKLKFKPLTLPNETTVAVQHAQPGPVPSILTIAEAKKSLAITYGVRPEAVEITIRG